MVFQFTRRLKIDLVFGATLLLFIIVAIFAFRSIYGLRSTQDAIQTTEESLRLMAIVPLNLKDAEAAQRGFLLTRDEEFLERYYPLPGMVATDLGSIAEEMSADTAQARRVELLTGLAGRRVAFLDAGLDAGLRGDFQGAAEVVRSGGGREIMDSIADVVSQMAAHEFVLLQLSQRREREAAGWGILLVALGGALTVMTLAGSRQSVVSELRARERAERKLSEHNEAIRELYRIASSQDLAVDGKIQALIDMGTRRLGMSVGVLADTDNGKYQVEAVHDPSGRIRRLDTFPIEDTYCAAVLERNAPVLFESTAAVRGQGSPSFMRAGHGSYIGMPVMVRGGTVGTLSFLDTLPRDSAFTQGDVDFIQLVAQWIGHELERVEAAAALQQREERYRVLVESASDVIFTTDEEGRLSYVNPAGSRTVGYTTSELSGMPSIDLVHPDWREEFRDGIRSQVQAGRVSSYYEIPVVTKEGQTVWLGQSVQLLRANGRLIGMQAVARDITRQLEVEQMKDSFLSIVSHELRTPLTAIRGSLGLLASGKMGKLEERGQRMLEIAAQNTDRLVRLINDLLDIEKIESGTAPMESRLVSLGDIIAQAAEEMRSLAEGANLVIRSDSTDVELMADRDRLLQVLTNLISNAVKFSNPGGSITITVDERPHEVRVAVSDEGRGIPADKRDAIFERFQQVTFGDAREKGGTGLGLPIARSIVQQHGGRLWVASELGRGSTFTFSLPRGSVPDVDVGRSVLVCEDDPTVATYVREILLRSDFEVIHVSTGSEVVSAAATMQPSVVLLDLSLPGINGLQVIDLLKTNEGTRHIPVVVMTAMRRSESGIGIDDVLGWVPKPIDRSVLIQTLEAALQGAAEFNVLIVEDDDDVAGVIAEILRSRGLTSRRARNGAEAIEISRDQSFELLLLDPGLPGMDGFALVDWLRRHNRHRTLPVLVYSARDLDEQDRDRLRLGPTEFMTKSRVSPQQLERRIAALFGQAIGVETGNT